MEFLNKIPAYILILRPKNLFITGLTLYILQYHIISPLIPGEAVLTGLSFIAFMITTLFIAASGNLVNDIFDRETDKINKPEKTYIPSIITVTSAWRYYTALIMAGAISALFVAWKTNQWFNLWIYPLACGVLFLYAKKWKSTVLTGNIIISLFVAMAWGILFYAQFSFDHQDLFSDAASPGIKILRDLCFSYFFFAFIINFIREIIKDLEDMEGDAKTGLRTYPLVKGEKSSIQLVSGLIVLLITSIITWVCISPVPSDYMIRFFYLLFVAGPLGRVLIMLRADPSPSTYKKASRTVKLVMLFALLALFLIQKNYS
jgi:4-hydroxybenzoate polyprenyltransferase